MIGACEVVPLPEGVRKRYLGTVSPDLVMVIFGAVKSSVTYVWLGHMPGTATARGSTEEDEAMGLQKAASSNNGDTAFFIMARRGLDGKRRTQVAQREKSCCIRKLADAVSENDLPVTLYCVLPPARHLPRWAPAHLYRYQPPERDCWAD